MEKKIVEKMLCCQSRMKVKHKAGWYNNCNTVPNKKLGGEDSNIEQLNTNKWSSTAQIVLTK